MHVYMYTIAAFMGRQANEDDRCIEWATVTINRDTALEWQEGNYLVHVHFWMIRMKQTNGQHIIYVCACCWRTLAASGDSFDLLCVCIVFFSLCINFRRYKQKQSNGRKKKKWSGQQRKKKEAIGTLLKNALPLFNCNRVGQSQLIRRLKCEHFVIGLSLVQIIWLDSVRFVCPLRLDKFSFLFQCNSRFCYCNTENYG